MLICVSCSYLNLTEAKYIPVLFVPWVLLVRLFTGCVFTCLISGALRAS